MIVRIWRGLASNENAESYHRHATLNVFPMLKNLAGHRGACLLRRDTAGGVEFLAVTTWDSIEAVKKFAGEDPDAAVVEPEARALLVEFDSFVRYYEIASGSSFDLGQRPVG